MPESRLEHVRDAFNDHKRVRILGGSQVTGDDLGRLGIDGEQAVVFMDSDGEVNLQLALDFRTRGSGGDRQPRLIVRMEDLVMGHNVVTLLDETDVFPVSETHAVAETFAAAALGVASPGSFNIWSTKLIMSRENNDRAVISWPIAGTEDALLAHLAGDGQLWLGIDARQLSPLDRVRSQIAETVDNVGKGFDAVAHRLRRAPRATGVVLVLLSAILVIEVAILMSDASAREQPGNAWQALYLFALTGGTNPDLDASRLIQAMHMLVAVMSSLLVPVALTVVFQALIDQRDEIVAGRGVPRQRGHVIVAGLGPLGIRVAILLRAQGIRVAAIERDPGAPGVDQVRAEGVPVLIGDAGDETALQRAYIKTARCLVSSAAGDMDTVRIAAAAAHLNSGLLSNGLPREVRVQVSKPRRGAILGARFGQPARFWKTTFGGEAEFNAACWFFDVGFTDLKATRAAGEDRQPHPAYEPVAKLVLTCAELK